MGSHVTKPSNKSMVDRLVERSCFIHTPEIEGVFRAVDRAMYFEIEEGDAIDPYEDDPWKRGNLHISAPCIYARVVGALKLESGLSFLNMGSGTGYLNTLIGLLIGPNGVNHGIELHGDVVEYAYKKLEQFKAKSRALDKYDFAEPLFIKGNCLNLNPNLRYDRIYLGAACLLDMEDSIKRLVKPNGGILVMPFGNRLMRHTRISENEWKSESLMDVNFTQMIGQGEDTTMIDMPNPSAKSLKDLCRIAIRRHLREKTDILYPNLLNSDNIDHRRARQMKVSKLMLKSKKSACSSESNNNICSMSSSSSMSRDKIICRCPNARNQRRHTGGDSNINNSNDHSRVGSRNTRGRNTLSRGTGVIGANDLRDVNQVRTLATSTTATTTSMMAETSRESSLNDAQETGRVMTRSASKILQASVDSNTTTASNDNRVAQQSLNCSTVGNTSRATASDQQDGDQSNGQSLRRLSRRPNMKDLPNRKQSTMSSSESTVGDSSGPDENDDDDGDNNTNSNSLGENSSSRYSNYCARTRPFRAQSGHHSDAAFSGIILGSCSRNNPQQRRHHSRQLRCATFSEPEDSNDSLDSDNMSPLREPWCVARQLRTHRARFLHLQRVGSSGNNPSLRINIEATPSTSESSMTSLADLILGDEYISSGDDSWDNSSSSTSDQSVDSFSDFDDNAGGDNRSNFCLGNARSIIADVEDEVYHDDADDIDGILDDNILAGHIESSLSGSSSNASEDEGNYYCYQNDERRVQESGSTSQVKQEATNATVTIQPNTSISDEPVARRLRSRAFNSTRSNLDDLQSTSENPESSASGRSDHETTTAEAGSRSTSARARVPMVLLPSTSRASATQQFRCPKHTSSVKRTVSSQTSRIGTPNVNCSRINHRNHKHCRRHCKEAQCQQADPLQARTSSSSFVASSDQTIAQSLPGTTSSSSIEVKSLVAGTSKGAADMDSSTESLSYVEEPPTSNGNSMKAASQVAIDRKRKRQSSSESSEISNEPSACWPTTSSCQHSASNSSKRGPRRRMSRRLRCSCLHGTQPQQTTGSRLVSASSRELDQSNDGTLLVMPNASATSGISADGNTSRSSVRPSQLADEIRDATNAARSTTSASRASFRTRFLLHNTWSSMFHRQIPTLDVLTRLSLHAAEPQDRLQQSRPSGSAVSCLASLWPQVLSTLPSRPHSQQHRNNSTSSTARRIGLVSTQSSGSSCDVERSLLSSSRRPMAAAASSAMDPSDGGSSSGVQQAPRQRVNCCCCRYCRNVRRSRRERKQQLHHQSKRADSRQHRSSHRRGRRKRETESEKYYSHMSGYIRQLPIPRVLHDYLNYERAF